jgi:hypothetical protein
MKESMYPAHTLDGIMAGLERTYSLGSILSSPAIADGSVYALR